MILNCMMHMLVVADATLAAMAYVGPGTGISAIGAAVGLLGAIVMMIIGFIWYPLKRVLRVKSQRRSKASASAGS